VAEWKTVIFDWVLIMDGSELVYLQLNTGEARKEACGKQGEIFRLITSVGRKRYINAGK